MDDDDFSDFDDFDWSGFDDATWDDTSTDWDGSAYTTFDEENNPFDAEVFAGSLDPGTGTISDTDDYLDPNANPSDTDGSDNPSEQDPQKGGNSGMQSGKGGGGGGGGMPSISSKPPTTQQPTQSLAPVKPGTVQNINPIPARPAGVANTPYPLYNPSQPAAIPQPGNYISQPTPGSGLTAMLPGGISPNLLLIGGIAIAAILALA